MSMSAEEFTKLGLRYCEEKKYVEAVRCFRQAVELGGAAAHYHLGELFEAGIGVSKDDKEAFRLLIRAAELGYVDAQVDVANTYKHGRGVPKNRNEAFKWFQKAAAQGDVEAQRELSEYGTTFHVYLNITDQGFFWMRQGNKALGPDVTISPRQATNHEQAVAFSLRMLTTINAAAANGDSSVVTILHDEIDGKTYTVGGETPVNNAQCDKKQGNNSGCLPILVFMGAVPSTILCLI